jgi:hypothetical protein
MDRRTGREEGRMGGKMERREYPKAFHGETTTPLLTKEAFVKNSTPFHEKRRHRPASA